MNKIGRILVSILLILLTIGMVCDYFYESSPERAISIREFQSQLNDKEVVAVKTIADLQKVLNTYPIDSLANYSFPTDGISYYVFENENMVFWSDNQLDIGTVNLLDSANWHYVELRNCFCVSKLVQSGSKKIIALITVKNNYSYENDELSNDFAAGFNIDKKVKIVNGKATDKFAVFCSHGNYLFSLEQPMVPIYNEFWALFGLLVFTLAYLIFIFIYAHTPKYLNRTKISIKTFSILSLIIGFLLGLALYFNVPNVFFLNKLFSPFQYSSNFLLASIIHLSIATAYFISTIFLFNFYVDTTKVKGLVSNLILQTLFMVYFGLVFHILHGLIYHSSIQLNILRFDDFSGISVWIHFLILLWGVGVALLFFATHQSVKSNVLLRRSVFVDVVLALVVGLVSLMISPENALRIGIWYLISCFVLYLPFIFPQRKNIYGYMAIWLFIYTAFIVSNSLIINGNKMVEKYNVLAQNIYINGNTENDRMADILLEELESKINNDKYLNRLSVNTDTITAVNAYLNNTYLRGFWNKYDMRLNIVYKNSNLNKDYLHFITNVGSRLKNTHFYSVPANDNNMSYIGAFSRLDVKADSIVFYMEFYPRRNFRSYSFPNLLISGAPTIQTKLNISLAKYENRQLVFSSGSVEYLPTNSWIVKPKKDFDTFTYAGYTHYVYSPNAATSIVITEQHPTRSINKILYFVYLFLAYFSLCWLIVWLFLLLSKKTNYRLGLTAKFQYAFILLLLISFVGIFYVSVNFIRKKYQDEQIANLKNKKSYIQKELQDMYYWDQDLNVIDFQKLNFDLQDLSYIYHTDIHVYNNQGELVGSSQPLIFNKSLISNRISPKPYFGTNSTINQYEHIGKLKYLTGYTDFVNGDYLQIGYIAIPQFFSQDEIRAEIESFLTVILHIYLIIIVLAILLSLFIGRQLSAPLYMIENKLKEMRLGQRNEKIDYTLNDEIGQLVLQYNRTVDELEQSAKLLAKSERESAWKSMARQVAHEINNPLTPMKLTIQQLQRTKQLDAEHFNDYFDKSAITLIEQIDNLSRIAGTFSNFARLPEAHFERMNLLVLLTSVVGLFNNSHEMIQLECTLPENATTVYADPKQLVQVFNNLLKNAMQAIPDHKTGKIKVTLMREDDNVVVEIEDNGTGVSDDIANKLFVPNFTTKNTGMGLGLAISKNIIEIARGTISFTSKLNEGTVFKVKLPLAD